MKHLKQTPACNSALSVVLCSAVLLLARPCFAENESRFSKFPPERAAFVDRMTQKAQARLEEAEAWAKRNGVPMRIDTGRQLKELVAIRNGKPLYIQTANFNAAISTAADLVRQTAPYNLDGAGLSVGIWDGGSVLTTHQEFGARITNTENIASHFHATHVGGTIAAAGVQPFAKGMAPAVWIDSYKWDNDYAEMALAAAAAPGLSTNWLYLSNHSYTYAVGWDSDIFYGFNAFGQYNSYGHDLDQLILDTQYYLPFWAAGNDRNDTGSGPEPGDGEYKAGYDTIAYSALAKNVITVGAVNDAVSATLRSPGNATMTPFSGWGPADDGRIKPDIVANGVNLYSCDNGSNAAYLYLSGTSMAAPNACGSAALLVEYYKELLTGGAMRASTLKGLLIHTADDLGNPGPDYQFGWGLMNTKAAADLLKDAAGNNPQRIVEGVLNTANSSNSYTITASGAEPLKVTLCWTDQPGLAENSSDNRTPDLVNDLDVKITGPGGTRYPYSLDVNNPSQPATAAGENSVDNVEQIYIENPLPGSYTITVDCDEPLLYYEYTQSPVQPDFHEGADQTYSLLISGLPVDSDNDGIPDHWETQYFSSTTGAVATVDADGDGVDNLTEYIAGYNPTDPASAPTPAFTPLFTNGASVIINWNSVTNRIYNIGWKNDLLSGTFTNISGDLPYPVNSYTDTVERTGNQNFYRISVRLNP